MKNDIVDGLRPKFRILWKGEGVVSYMRGQPSSTQVQDQRSAMGQKMFERFRFEKLMNFKCEYVCLTRIMSG